MGVVPLALGGLTHAVRWRCCGSYGPGLAQHSPCLRFWVQELRHECLATSATAGQFGGHAQPPFRIRNFSLGSRPPGSCPKPETTLRSAPCAVVQMLMTAALTQSRKASKLIAVEKGKPFARGGRKTTELPELAGSPK